MKKKREREIDRREEGREKESERERERGRKNARNRVIDSISKGMVHEFHHVIWTKL